jgi:SpoVK/Ycf46/Vps4 family AAA+-type ATPase
MIGAQNLIMQLQRRAQQLIEQARIAEQDGKLKEAAQALRAAAKLIREMADKEIVQRDRVRRYKKAREAEEMATALEGGKKVFGRDQEGGSDSVPAADEYRATVDELIYRANVTWDDIAGMTEVKDSLKRTLGLMLARMPNGVRLNIGSRILLYGPPGTGKTLLAAACSNMLGATFFNVKASNLLSKWFGESTQLISALFSRARSIADTGVAVIFIDEFDGLCRTRGEAGETGAERRILSTLLSELEGLADKGEASRVITIVATNKPWDIDEAILQRFKRHIFVNLPDQKAREEIFRIQVEGAGLQTKGIACSALAKRTQGYSGRLIERVCQYAIDEMVRDVNPGVTRAVDDKSVADYEIKVRPLTSKDFEHGLKRVKPGEEGVTTDKYAKWAAKTGGEKT